MTTYAYLGPAAHTSIGANSPVTRIVIHGTVSACKAGGAREVAAYFRTQSAGGSAHYVVDPGEIVQVVHDDTIAWHAPPNKGSIGIELCDPQAGPGARWSDANHKAMLAKAATLAAEKCIEFKLPAIKLVPSSLIAGKHGICGHVDVSNAWHQSDHTDPGPDFPWTDFIHQVKAEVTRLEGAPVPAPKPVVPIDTPYTRTRARLAAAVNHPDARAIAKGRLRFRALLATIRAGLAATPKA